jgi:PucR C-terminal helix-turn-helix domain
VSASATGKGAVLTPLQQLADELLARVDAVAERAVQRMQEQLPSYASVPREELVPVLLENTRNILRAVRDPEAEPPDLGDHYRESGETRARQGISSDEMLHGWRIGLESVREEAHTVARERDLDDGVLLAFVEATLRLGDAGMLASASAHRAAELEIARHEQHHRANLVRGVLFGTLSPAAIRVQSAAYGLDPAATYCAVRARPTSDVTVRSLEAQLGIGDTAGPRRGLAALLDGDLAGFVLAPLRGPIRATVGVGPAGPLHTLETSFRLATRTLEAALALGREGAIEIEQMGLAPAVIADGDIGDALTARIIDPIIAQGRAGMALLQTVTRYLDNDLRLDATAAELFLHVNTVRYRLRRFEELTSTELRRVEDLVEIWWAIQRARLAGTVDL